MSRRSDSLLVGVRSTSFISQDESGSNPNSAGAQHQGSSDSLSIIDTTGCDNLHWLASHRARLALAKVDNCGDQNSCGDISSVSTTLASLCANDINTKLEALLD